jgi:hypothetical protein
VHAYALVQPGLADVGVDGEEQERKGHVPQEGGRKPLVQTSEPQLPHDAHRRLGAVGRLGALHLQPDLHCDVGVVRPTITTSQPPPSHPGAGWVRDAGGTDLRRVGHGGLAHPSTGSRQDLVCQRDSAKVGHHNQTCGVKSCTHHLGRTSSAPTRLPRKAMVGGEGTNWSWSRAARCSRSFSLTASLTAFSGATPHRHAPSPR